MSYGACGDGSAVDTQVMEFKNSHYLSEITMEKFLSQTGISFDATYLGKTCNVTLDYSQYVNMAPLMSGDFEITITMCE